MAVKVVEGCGFVDDRSGVYGCSRSSKGNYLDEGVNSRVVDFSRRIPTLLQPKCHPHLAKDVAHHSRTKHIHKRYHWLHERVEDKNFGLMKIHTTKNGSNMLMKVLSTKKLGTCRKHVRLMKHSMTE